MSGAAETASSLGALVPKLSLSQWHPGKLTVEEANAVGMTDSTKVGLRLIRQLISCNAKARDEVALPQQDQNLPIMETDRPDDGWDEDDDEAADSGVDNPVDILLASFVCCSDDLKQLICQRLFMCKLAFPFLYRDEANKLVTNHENLRAIAVEYKDQLGRAVELPVFSEQPVLCVAFVRIGSHSISKSKMLNLLLNDGRHETFFNRESVNGSSRLKFSRGLVEAAMYLPTGGSNNPFVALNLRGDVRENLEQGNVLSKCASVVVCFVAVEDVLQDQVVSRLKELAAESNNLVLILTKRDPEATASSSLRNKILESMREVSSRMKLVLGFKNRNCKSLREVQGDVMKALEETECDFRVIAEHVQATGLFSDVRESSSEMSELAAGITKNFHNCEDKTHFKEKFLPLHMNLWQEYSRLHKKTQSAKFDKEDLSKLQEQMLTIRNKQVESCMELSPIIKDLFAGLNSTLLADKVEKAIVLLEGIRQRFYESGIKVIPPLQGAYLEAKRKLDDCLSSTEAEALKETCLAAERNLINASLDLISLFREAGQIYESSKENSIEFTPRLKSEVSNLPNTFAQLLLHGIPLEILDGDSSNIPIIWISEVLRACYKLVGEKKLFVISVLGVQSSGKSTLLNTMFGLRFPVSAGRCTRGAYLQILRVSRDSGLPFDYVAIIDTEGLKAPELGSTSPRHDNELATLVIGLGDVSIVNIKGENSSDMSEILPIAVNAFLRMRQVNKRLEIQRSCVFIHQNVSAVSAKEKMEEATVVMKKRLDDFTREAAEAEGLADVRYFSDVISFDSKTDIFFMPDLWFGDPPLASVNPGYTEKVLQIREHIVFNLSQRQQTFVTFHDFSIRIGDMWKAIVSEDFVFSFRNSIEMKAYHHMELALIDCKDKIDDFGNEWLHKTAFVRIKMTTSEERLTEEFHKLQREMCQEMSCALSDSNEKLEKYFEEDSYKEYSVQWKQGTLLTLERACNTKQEELEDRMKDEAKIQRLEISQSAKHKQWEKLALQRAKDLAETITSREISEDIISQGFDNMWETIISELPSEQPHSGVPISEQIAALLSDLFHKDASILKHSLEQNPLSNQLSEDDVEPFLSDCLEEARFANDAAPAARTKTFIAGAKVFESVKPLLRDIRNRDSGFYAADARKILSEVIRVIREKRSDLSADGVSLTVAFEMKVAIGVCRLAMPIFTKIDQAYRQKLSVKARLAALKEKIFNLYKNMVECKTGEKIAADFVADHVAELIKAAVLERMTDKLKVHLRNQIGRHKYYLIVMMLSEWANKDDFQSVISYVKNSKTAALNWLTSFINRFLFTRNESNKTAFAEIVVADVAASIFKKAYESCEEASKAMKGISGHKCLARWSEDFGKLMSRELAVRAEDLAPIFGNQIGNFSDFAETLKEGLRVKSRQLTDWLGQMDETLVKWQGSATLYSAVLECLWGCDSQCPFCNEPCSNATAGHHNVDGVSHKCIQHRPTCASGMQNRITQQAVPNTCGYSIQDQNRSFSCTVCVKNRVHTDECNQFRAYHPYKNYKKFFPAWDIAPDPANSSSKYWMWFVWTFREQLKAEHGYKIDEIPEAWSAVTKEAADKSLRDLLD